MANTQPPPHLSLSSKEGPSNAHPELYTQDQLYVITCLNSSKIIGVFENLMAARQHCQSDQQINGPFPLIKERPLDQQYTIGKSSGQYHSTMPSYRFSYHSYDTNNRELPTEMG